MAWHLVNSVSMSNAFSSPVTSSAISTIGADLIVFCFSGSGAPALSDNQGNTYTPAVSTSPSQNARIAYVSAPTTSATHTFSANNNNSSCAILAYSGSLPSPLDQTNSANITNPTTEQPGSITPLVNGELLVFACSLVDPAASSASFDSGFAQQFFLDVVPGSTFGLTVATLVQATAGAINPTMTRGTAGTNTDSALIASFKPTNVVVPNPAFPRLVMM